MTTRTLYTPTALEVLTAANLNKLAGGWIGWTSITSDQGSITTEVDITGASLTVTVPASRLIRIRLITVVNADGTSNTTSVKIKEDTTQLAEALNNETNTNASSLICEALVSAPSAGSHTYKATIFRATGAGVISIKASATRPTYFYVEDMGPSS